MDWSLGLMLFGPKATSQPKNRWKRCLACFTGGGVEDNDRTYRYPEETKIADRGIVGRDKDRRWRHCWDEWDKDRRSRHCLECRPHDGESTN